MGARSSLRKLYDAKFRPGKLQLNSVGLLLGHVSDNRQFELLTLVGLEDQEKPKNESSQTDQRPQEDRGPTEEWDVAKEGEEKPQDHPGDGEENVLKSMKSHEAVAIIGLDRPEK